MQSVERVVMLLAAETMIHHIAWRQIFRKRTPLAIGAQHIHQAVHHLTHIHRLLVAIALGSQDLRLNQEPLLVRQIAGIVKLAAVIMGAVLDSPHREVPAKPSLSQ